MLTNCLAACAHLTDRRTDGHRVTAYTALMHTHCAVINTIREAQQVRSAAKSRSCIDVELDDDVDNVFTVFTKLNEALCYGVSHCPCINKQPR